MRTNPRPDFPDIEEQYIHLSGHLVPYETSIRPAERLGKLGRTEKKKAMPYHKSLLDDMAFIIAPTRSLKTLTASS